MVLAFACPQILFKLSKPKTEYYDRFWRLSAGKENKEGKHGSKNLVFSSFSSSYNLSLPR